MTISATGRAGGFSLLEILVTLGVIALFVGFFTLRFDDGPAEEALSKAAGDLKGAALTAKREAQAFRTGRYVVLTPGGFSLADRPPRPDQPDSWHGGPAPGTDARWFPLPPGVTMVWREPGTSQWKGRESYVWHFRESGLSDPVAVRFTHGRSYWVLDFHVLTGMAEEEIFIE